MSANKAIRAYCYSCGEGTFNAIRDCDNVRCRLHPYRHGKRNLFEGDVFRPTHIIRKHCYDCSFMYQEIVNCPVKDCPLYPYRVRIRRKGKRSDSHFAP